MPKNFYGVANGRTTGVYDNWEDCRNQVDGYSRNNYRGFDTPHQAWDFVDQHSSAGNAERSFASNSRAVARNNQGYQGEASGYRRTDVTEGRHSVVVRDRSYTSGRQGNEYFVEEQKRTYWKNN